ncbi:MAG: ATP-dependent helicase HrpB [Actinomycetota bacterium]|nr:ATP-dependent helicase HrpB [Actinomycetota bacterium]
MTPLHSLVPQLSANHLVNLPHQHSFALPDLPIQSILDDIRETLATSRRCVISAPPGAGKSTLVPLHLLNDGRVSGRIVVLEPRRVAARAVAQRMAELSGTALGELVGYRTRDDAVITKNARIEVVTEGILTRRLQNDPGLPGTSILIFDEVHERNLATDIGLAFSIDVASTLRPDLAICTMSATADTDRMSRLLDGAPVLTCDGRTFDVEIRWRPLNNNRRNTRPPTTAELISAMTDVITRALDSDDGDVLAFLPGIGEINRLRDALSSVIDEDISIHRLAGSVPREEQDAALRRAHQRRSIILATDIAETSLTVDGVNIVVDSGLVRVPRFDSRTGMTRLTTIVSSRSSAEQRSGRAGRTGPGVCYRLWSKVEHTSRLAFPEPEINSVELSGFALELAKWGGDSSALRLPTKPSAATLRAATELLATLGAVSEKGLTPVGEQMLRLPVHPRLARMVIARPTSTAAVIAALLDDGDIAIGRPDERPTDLTERLEAVLDPSRTTLRFDRQRSRRVHQRSEDLARRAGIDFSLGALRPGTAGELLAHAFPDRIARLRRRGQFQLTSGSGAWMPESDPLSNSEFVIAIDLDGRRDGARIRLAAPISEERVIDTLEHLGQGLTTRSTLEWDSERNDLVLRVQRRLGVLRLDEQLRRPEPGPETTAALLDRLRATRLAALPWTSDSLHLRERVTFCHLALGAPWPDWSIDGLLTTVDSWLTDYLMNATSQADIDQLNLTTLLRASLPWPDGAELDNIAPAVFRLPNGRDTEISYLDDNDEPRPTVRARVQDVFGLDDHPTVAHMPITFELLSPADRPIQVTSDLPGFWRGSWSDVRKELAGRYPKHRWPEHPHEATPGRLRNDD